MPAQSPTLSPTLSAITAGLRGSSSGIPASTLPTRSAPTSAPLVKMPPPSRAKTLMRLDPKARPISGRTSSAVSPRIRKYPATDSRPRPTTSSPVTAPPRKAMPSAGPRPRLAASAVRTLARTETFMPMKPAAAEATAPIRKPIAASHPSRAESTVCPRRPMRRKSTTATPAMIVYWRVRYAWAPSCTAAAISRIRSSPAGWRRR